MRSYDGTPLVCSGSIIGFADGTATMVDQTPVMVREALAAGEGLVELTHDGVSSYIAVDAPVTRITPTFVKTNEETT